MRRFATDQRPRTGVQTIIGRTVPTKITKPTPSSGKFRLLIESSYLATTGVACSVGSLLPGSTAQ